MEGFDLMKSKLDLDYNSSVGPANYLIERVIGKKNIIQSHISSVP